MYFSDLKSFVADTLCSFEQQDPASVAPSCHSCSPRSSQLGHPTTAAHAYSAIIAWASPGPDAGPDGTGYCRPGHEGPRCRACNASDEYFDALDYAREPCENKAGPMWVSRLLQYLLPFGVLALLFLTCRAGCRYAPETCAPLRRLAYQARLTIQAVELVPRLKLLIGFYQVRSLRCSTPPTFIHILTSILTA